MSHLWFTRETAPTFAWASRAAGEINGNATVQDAIERDLLLLWTVNGGVEADLALLWQVEVSSATAVESDLTLSWNVITAATGYVESDLELLWQNHGSVTSALSLLWQVGLIADSAGVAVARRTVKHPGWQRKQAMDAIARERAMERSIRAALNGEEPAALAVELPRQRTAAQMAAEMASAERVQATRQRATEAAIEAQRARVEIQRLQPELTARRQAASYRVIEQLLRQA